MIGVTIVFLSLMLILGFPAEADSISIVDTSIYGGAAYTNELGVRGGVEFSNITPAISILGEGAVYDDTSNLRAAGAYEILGQNKTKLKGLAGAGFYFSDENTEFDLHLGTVLEQKITDKIALRGDVIWMPGAISDLESEVESSLGLSYTF